MEVESPAALHKMIIKREKTWPNPFIFTQKKFILRTPTSFENDS